MPMTMISWLGVLLIGMALFVVASVLCAASPGMGWLIAFRTLQGIGAGCIQPLVFTIVGDVFPIVQRARLQGFFGAMWAIAVQANIATAPRRPARKIRVVVLIMSPQGRDYERKRKRVTSANAFNCAHSGSS